MVEVRTIRNAGDPGRANIEAYASIVGPSFPSAQTAEIATFREALDHLGSAVGTAGRTTRRRQCAAPEWRQADGCGMADADALASMG